MELPQEDLGAQEGDIGRLNVCLYGTRGAARELQKFLRVGRICGQGHPSVRISPLAEEDK